MKIGTNNVCNLLFPFTSDPCQYDDAPPHANFDLGQVGWCIVCLLNSQYMYLFYRFLTSVKKYEILFLHVKTTCTQT